MGRIVQQYKSFISRCHERGAKLLHFPCPVCSSDIETLAAPQGDIWDTTSICPFCDCIYLKVVNDTAVLTQSIPGVTDGQNHHHIN